MIVRSCKQPASLATLTSNKHMIGKNEKYSFASGECMRTFKRIVSSYTQGERRSVRHIICPILIHKMSKNTMPRQTRQALMDIHTASLRVVLVQYSKDLETVSLQIVWIS